MDIAAWLQSLGLERYARTFREHEVDLDVLGELTEADLEKLGIPLGPRKKLLRAIAGLAARETPVAAPAATAEQLRAEAERRQLTVMFVDLVGSTELSTRLDPEDMGALIRAFQGRCADVVQRWGGHLAKFMGDGALVYFGWPQAHEDDAERAVRAGLELAQAVAGLTTPAAARLAARIGIATGPVLVGDLAGEGAAQEEAVVGETPNLAARLQALAEPGTVVVAARTRRLLGGLFALTDLGPVRLKGFSEPLAAFRVEGEGHAEGRFEALHGGRLTPLVGREHELAILLERWARAKDGDGQVVLLAGEAGIGKSRLLLALREELAAEPHVALSHFCSPYHTNSALHPIISQLERAAGLTSDDEPEAKLAKLEALLGQATDRLDEAIPLLAALLGIPADDPYPPLSLSPQRQKQRTLEVLIEQLGGLARNRPVLEVYEDLHWVDPSTLELLDLLVERVRSLPVLVLLTYRPEFSPPWSGQAHVTALPLNRLGRRQGAAMVTRLTAGKALPDEVLDQIVARTDGVPLFVEELTKTVLESGVLEDAGNRFVLSAQLPAFAIPASLHDSLMARLDRLGPVKEVAQIGAVLGREFSHRLLAAVVPMSANQLTEALARLAGSELVFRRGVPPEATYSFKHALVQDAAYQSLLKSTRRLLHERTATVLEQRFSDTPPEVVARHCTEAGLTEKAVGYWHLAGKRAMELSAYREAINHLQRSRELLLTQPPSRARDVHELDLQLALGAAWIPAKAYSADEVRRAYQTALELCRRVGSADQRFVALRGLWNNHLMRLELSAARTLAAELQATAEETGDPERRLVAERAAGSGLMALGEHREANACFRRGMACYDPARHRDYLRRYGEDSGLWCYSYAAWSDDWLGHRDRALSTIRQATEIARLATTPTLVITLANAATVYQFRRELDLTLACAEETIGLADRLEMIQLRAWAAIHKGWALACGGHLQDGLAEIEAALATWRAIGGLNNRTHFLNLFADACRLAGKAEAGMVALDEAEDIARQNDLHAHDVETYRRRGELLLALNRAGDAEDALREAIRIAHSQGTRTLELRAALDLARLWASQGKTHNASHLLIPIYNSFTEGLDTLDLRDAKALLDELRQPTKQRLDSR